MNKRFKRLTQVGFLALGFLAVGAANADNASPASAIEFSSLDANSDGKVSTSEVQFVDDLRESFAKLDVNGDRELTPAEFARWERAGKTEEAMPVAPSTGPSGSSGAQHVPESN